MTTSHVANILSQLGEPDVAFHQAAIGMAMVDFDGRFLRVNPALRELVGRTEGELLAMRWQDVTHPDDVRRGEEEVDRTLAGLERTFRLNKRYVHSCGNVVWVLLSVSLIRSPHGQPLCLFTQAVDITEQRHAEEAAARLAAIVESSDDGILSMALDGTILIWNRGAKGMYGYGAEEMIGRNVLSIVPAQSRDEVDHLLRIVAGGQAVTNHETLSVRRDDTVIDVSMTISPIRDSSGQVVRASVISRDITRHKQTVSDLDATLAALESALDEAQSAEEHSRRFLSDAAHHLRNPIGGIRSCVEAMLRGCPATDRERLFAEIVHDTALAARLVDRLLRMSRLEQGEPLMLEAGDLVDLCRDAVERARSLTPTLHIGIAAEPVPQLKFDRGAVREIVASVLDNGSRYAEQRIDVTVYRSDGMACVRVRDDGPGLPPSDLARAFEPFVSLDGSGSGLGLAVSQAAARAHGGELAYSDRSFVLRLPTG
jgi:PAS domain S-box-containing protein